MKTSKTFSIDAEVYSKARAKHNNLSLHVENLLRADLETNTGERSEQALAEEVKRQESIIASLNAELVSKKEELMTPKHDFDYVEDEE